jgi:hypothetical protein
VGVGAGSRFMNAVARAGPRGEGDGLGTFRFAFVTTTSGFSRPLLSLRSRPPIPPSGFSV